jgi:hypothetical protein
MAGMHRRTDRIMAEAKRHRVRDRVIPDHGPPAPNPWWLNDVEPRFWWTAGQYRGPQEFAKNPLTNFPSRPPHPWPTGVRWADMTPVVGPGRVVRASILPGPRWSVRRSQSPTVVEHAD